MATIALSDDLPAGSYTITSVTPIPPDPPVPPVAPPVNPPPDNGVSWHATARFVPADTHAKGNFNYLMGLKGVGPASVYGLCYGALDTNISNLLQTIPNIGTSAEQRSIINTFQNSSYNFGCPHNLFLPTSPNIDRVHQKMRFQWGVGQGPADQTCTIALPYPIDSNPIT